MKLPANFQFSPSNLQDFTDCPRRFQLKHLVHLAWPAMESEPVVENERLVDLGLRFHHLMLQFFLGIPVNGLKIPDQEEELNTWWKRFQAAIIEGGTLQSAWMPSTIRYPEVTLVGRLGDAPLVAKMDLVVVHPDGMVQIFDWKTAQNVPKREWLAERLQTKVYPYLLVNCGAFLNDGHSISPDQIELFYWYPSVAETLVRFQYSQNQYQRDSEYLQSVWNTLMQLSEEDFEMTLLEQRCKYCVYRSLCERGVAAGQLSDFENGLSVIEDVRFGIDFGQIDEVSY